MATNMLFRPMCVSHQGAFYLFHAALQFTTRVPTPSWPQLRFFGVRANADISIFAKKPNDQILPFSVQNWQCGMANGTFVDQGHPWSKIDSMADALVLLIYKIQTRTRNIVIEIQI